MLTLLLAGLLATSVEVERVLAVVNDEAILTSDVQLAELANLVPREQGETDKAYHGAVLEALIELDLRWQDLESSGLSERVEADVDGAWAAAVKSAGGQDQLDGRLREIGLPEVALRRLVRRAAIVQAYVSSHFAPFVRPTVDEIKAVYDRELLPATRKAGEAVPELAAVRPQIEEIVRQRKLLAEVDRWTKELAARGQVVRYYR
ncbi:MAG: hypothetical protein ACM3O7_10840 [Acidobacteriota bacterium]